MQASAQPRPIFNPPINLQSPNQSSIDNRQSTINPPIANHRIYDSAYLLNSKAPLVPPNPNEFDSAYSIVAARLWLGT
jgi:hypothetical protein